MTNEEKGKKEIEIFKSFINCINNEMKIDVNSIKSNDNNKKSNMPDITYLQNGKYKYCELTESIYQLKEQRFRKAIKFQERIKYEFNKLDKITKNNIDNKYRGKVIKFYFNNSYINNDNNDPNDNQIIYAIPNLFKELENIPEDFDGCKTYNNKYKVLKSILITKEDKNPEPVFDVDSSGIYSNFLVIEDLIKKKFKKYYCIDNKLSLLIYISNEVDFYTMWKDLMDDFIKKEIKDSQFSSIWIFSLPKNKILYQYHLE